jgi:cytidine deaminase
MKNIYQTLKTTINNAYVPYSKFKVAALVETDKGNYLGVNVENASYSATICAERVAVTNAVANGAKKFSTLYLLTNSSKTDVVPCGICLQVMSEFFKANAKIIVFNKIGKHKIYLLSQLLSTPFKLQK